MQIFNNNEHVLSIYNKSISLLIGKGFAEQLNGKVSVARHQDSEQLNRRRELLSIEEETNKNKIIEAHGKNHFKTQVMEQFFAKVTKQINTEFDNKDNLYNTVLNIEDAAPAILEILCLNAASIKRIAPLINSLPWLSSEVVNLVNKPQYRKRADVQVSDPTLAISYVGLDNLKLVMPTFIIKHWLPSTTSPFPLLKRKLWNDSLSIALASSVLAEQEGLDKFTAFTTGMFCNIGRLAVTCCSLQNYNELYKSELQKAYDNKDKKLHDILIELDSAPDLLLEQLTYRSDKVAADMIELMQFDRLQIIEPIFDLAYANNYKDMCPIAQIVAKAKTFIAFRNLTKEELISKDEAKTLLSAVNMTQNCINLLKKSDINHIKLQFN